MNEQANDSLPDHWYLVQLVEDFQNKTKSSMLRRFFKFALPQKADDIGELAVPSV